VEETISISRSEYEQLLSVIAELREKVQQLQVENELLKNGRNSKTNSTAHSHDIIRSNVHSMRRISREKTGDQKCHPDHHLSMSDTPDIVIEHILERCSCGHSFGGVALTGQTRCQVIDIPPIKPHCTEHRSYHKICPHCGMGNRDVYSDEVFSPVQYGRGIKSLLSYLFTYQFLPYKRLPVFFRCVFLLPVSEGSIDNILEEMSQKSEVAYRTIQERILKSEIVGSDEMGCRVNCKKHLSHVWDNSVLTFIVSFAGIGHKVMEEYFPGGFLQPFYVSNCWASQLKTKAKVHQLCTAHLLRELLNFEKSLHDVWSVRMKELLYRAIALKRTMLAEDYQNSPEEVAKLNEELGVLLSVDASCFHRKEQAFINRPQKHRESIFAFLLYLNTPPDNSGSERAIRNVKVKTKVSAQFRNTKGKVSDRFARIRSVIDTTVKNGQIFFCDLKCLADIECAKST
jgi:hypothetical protein